MTVSTFCLVCAAMLGADAEPAPNQQLPAVESDDARRAIVRALEFLEADVVKWRKEHDCATCHHGVMTVWALSEASRRGIGVKPESLAEITQWTKAGVLAQIDQPRDARPGWNMVSTPALYLAAMSRSVPAQDVVGPKEYRQIAGHLLRHQESDGSWIWSSAPAKNRAPPVFESDEVATLLALGALGAAPPGDPMDQASIQIARREGIAWLKQASPSDTTQAAALRLLTKKWGGVSADQLRSDVDSLVQRANPDGGWPQIPGARSDAYATGQALYILRLAGADGDREALRRGVRFLIDTQQADGSWLMTRRGHPGATPTKNVVPITYFGAAWGTLGLLRAVEK